MIPTTSHQHVALKYSFGLNSQLRNGLHLKDDQHLLFASGYQVVMHNCQDKTQQYFQGLENYLGISCFNLSPLKRYLALGLKADKPAISVYDTKNHKRLKSLKLSEEYNVKEFVSIIFSPEAESRNIISLTGGGGEVVLTFWQYDIVKCLANIRVSQSHIEVLDLGINHNDTSMVTVLGEKIFRCYKVQENQDDATKSVSFKNTFSQINGPAELPGIYAAHLWLKPTNELLVCSELGELMIMNPEGEFKYFIEQSPKSLTKSNWKVAAVAGYSKGFVVAGQGLAIYVYKYNTDSQVYEKTNLLSIKKEDFKEIDFKEFSSVAINPVNEDRIYASLSSNVIMAARFKYDANEFEQETAHFETVSMAFHSGVVNDIDLCLRKPLIASCGADKYIKIWNYEEKMLEISKNFPDESKCVSIHPGGYQIVVGSSDKLKMIALVNHRNQLKIQKEITVKQVKEVQYSHGGQYFAAVAGSAVNSQMTVMIYCSYTGENVNNWAIRGHTGRIRNIKWTRDDRHIVTCGVDGQVNCWRIQDDIQKMHYVHNKQIHFQSVAIANDLTMYAAGNDGNSCSIREIQSNQTETKLEMNVNLSQLAFPNNNKILFAGVSDENRCSGEIRCYKFPHNGVYSSYQAHESTGIEKMKLSVDDQHVVTCGKDGVINVFEVKDKEIRSIKSDKQAFSQEILITKQDIEDINQSIKTLNQSKRDNSTLQNNSLQMQSKDDELVKMQDKFSSQKQNEIKRYNANLQEKTDFEKKYQKELKLLAEQQEQEMADLDTSYQRRVMTEVANYEEAKRQQDYRNSEYEKNKQLRKQAHQNTLAETERRMHLKLESIIQDRKQLQAQIVKQKDKNEMTLNQIQQETQQEIQNILKENQEDITKITDKGLKCKSEVKITEKKIQQQSNEKKELKEKSDDASNKEKQIKKNNEMLVIENEKYKLEIEERDKQISEKEKKIYELKKRSQELEKFKFVLDHRIKELRRDIGPREEEIQNMKDQTNAMDKNLKRFNNLNNTLIAVIDDLDQTIKNMKQQIKQARHQIQGQNVKIKSFKNEVYQAAQHILDYDQLKAHAEKLMRTYVTKDIKPVDVDPDIQAEYVNQRMHLQKCVDMYTKNLSKDSEIHKLNNVRIMRENVDLIFVKYIKRVQAIKRHRIQLNNAKFKKPNVDDTLKQEQQLQVKKKTICKYNIKWAEEQNNKIEKLQVQLSELENSLYQ